MGIKIKVEEHKCIGAGQCVLAAPALFDQREDDGIVILLQPNPSDAQAPAAHRAAKLCPARAIIVEET